MSQKPDLKPVVFEMLERLPALLELEKIQAKLTRTRFEALVKEGFTEGQALELCKKPI